MPNDSEASIARLTELIPPPKRPLRASDDGNWKKLADAIDFPFPVSFLEYGRTYGTGEFDAGGYVLKMTNPLDPKYPKWALEQSAIMRTRGDGPERRDTRFYPEPGGVLPFASDLSGDLVFFTREATIASCPTDPNILIQYEYDFVGFLCALFSGALSPEFFPNSAIKDSTPAFKKRAWI